MGHGIVVSTYGKGVFVNGFMHMLEFTQIVAIDMEGKTWRKIHRPTNDAISIHEALGQLCLCTVDTLNRYELSIWILEDYGTNEWTLKHTISIHKVFTKTKVQFGYLDLESSYSAIIVHPEWNLILFVGGL